MDSLTNLHFLKLYDDYKIKNTKKIDNLIIFLSSLNVNKNYYNIKNTKYYNNQNKNIKSIHNFLNKCSISNIDKIVSNISELINKDIVDDILKSIIDKCIIEPGYNDLYIQIIKSIVNKYKLDISTIIDKCIQCIYIEKTYTKDYDGLCEYNQSSDKCIALSLLISKLETNLLIQNYTKSIIEKCFDKINKNNDNDIIFKYVCCLFKLFESNKMSIYIFNDQLHILKKNILCKKIQFKVMDILDLKK